MKTFKTNKLFAVLMLVSLIMLSLDIIAQTKELKTEGDGFQWYKLEQNGKEGAQSMSGTIFIPLSRGYTFICYHETNGGWFSVFVNGSQGACDITGREIVAPGRYDEAYYLNRGDGRTWCEVKLNGKKGACDMNGREVITPRYDDVMMFEDEGIYYFMVWLNGKVGACDITGREIIAPQYESLILSEGVFKYEDASGNWVSTGVSLPKTTNSSYASNNSSSSSSSSPSTSSSSNSSSSSSASANKSKEAGLLYIGDYTQGTAVSQSSGMSIAPAMPHHNNVKIYEDHVEDIGNWKFEGMSGGSRVYSQKVGWNPPTTVKYYVDGNYNITEYREVPGMYGIEIFVSHFTKGNVAFDSNNANGNNGGSSNYQSGHTGNTPKKQNQHKCSLCNGTGRVINTDGVSFGNTKWCSECGKTVPDYHYHTTCPSCKGKGWW